jgi:hypothetical protein
MARSDYALYGFIEHQCKDGTYTTLSVWVRTCEICRSEFLIKTWKRFAAMSAEEAERRSPKTWQKVYCPNCSGSVFARRRTGEKIRAAAARRVARRAAAKKMLEEIW